MSPCPAPPKRRQEDGGGAKAAATGGTAKAHPSARSHPGRGRARPADAIFTRDVDLPTLWAAR